MESGAQWAIVIVALFLAAVNLTIPARSARFRRRIDPKFEARLASARQHGGLDELGREVGFFRRWIYRDYFYPRGARLMAVPYLVVGTMMALMMAW